MSGPEGLGRPSDDPDRPEFSDHRLSASQPTASRATAHQPTPVDRYEDQGAGPPSGQGGRWVPVTRAETVPSAERRRPGRRSGRAPVVLVVVVLVLAGLLVAGDRLGARFAEQRVATALQTRLGTAQPPTVEIVHTPFLTQLAGRNFAEVRVRTGPVPGTDTQLALAALDLTLRGVRPDPGFDTLRVSRLSGTARLDYAVLSGKLGRTVRYAGRDSAGRGRIGFDLTTTIFGQTIRATVTGRPGVEVASQSVTMADTQITVSGLAIPTGLAQRLVDGILQPVRLDDLPFGISLASLDVEPTGLVAGVSGTGLTIPAR